MKIFTTLVAIAALTFGTVASAATVLTVDFGGVYGGTLDGTFGSSTTFGDATGTDINISTITIQDDTGTTVYDVQGGLLNFDTTSGVVITGGVTGLTITDTATVLFDGGFLDWEYLEMGQNEVFLGEGGGTVGLDVMSEVVSTGINPFSFIGFSLESANGDVLSTDFLMTASETKRPPEVPIPAAVWLFGSGLIGLVGVARRKV